MNRQLKILLTGLVVVVPFAITVWLIWTIGLALDELGINLALKPIWDHFQLHDRWSLQDIHGVGAVILIVAIYLIGLLMHFWLFRWLVGLFQRMFEHVPGVKAIYESVRDLMKLFGSESRKMGQVVEYLPPGSQMGVLGILTNEQPSGASGGDKVAVYFPLAYMIGGPVLFVPKDHLREVDMPVERAMRICATAQIGIESTMPPAIQNITKATDASPDSPPDSRQPLEGESE